MADKRSGFLLKVQVFQLTNGAAGRHQRRVNARYLWSGQSQGLKAQVQQTYLNTATTRASTRLRVVVSEGGLSVEVRATQGRLGLRLGEYRAKVEKGR